MYDRRSPLFMGPPAVGTKALPFGPSGRRLHHKRLAWVDVMGHEALDMAIATMLTHRAEGLPEPEMGLAGIGESGVRRSQRPAREVS